MKKKALILMMAVGWMTVAFAQPSKHITVSQGASYTDHLSMKKDSRDMDLMVKFVFNEDKNTLTVSLISYRTLFVFWDDVPYKGTFKRRWLRPYKLSYAATSNPDDRFRLNKAWCKTLPKPYKKHVFKKWIEVEGLQAVPQELKLVNDYIEQTFDIQNKRNDVVVRLNDIMLMDIVKQKGKANWYELTYGKDFQLEYQIAIQRNPCFGLDEELGAAQKSLEAVRKSYQSLNAKYGKKKLASEEARKNFQDLKETLTTQFPKNNDKSPCPDIQQAHDQYNLIVDSLHQITVTVENSNSGEALAAVGGAEGRALNAKNILGNARLLDKTVSRWLVCKDEAERNDLFNQCLNIIKDTSTMVGNGRGTTPEERNAVTLFRQAEQYFKRTCK